MSSGTVSPTNLLFYISISMCFLFFFTIKLQVQHIYKLKILNVTTLSDRKYLLLSERSWTAITQEGGETAVVGQGVDKVDVPVSKPVDAEYDEVIASSTDGLPFRKSLERWREEL